MESHISPNNIQERSEAVAANVEKEAADKVAAEKVVADKAVADKAAADAAAKPADTKPVDSVVDPSKKIEVKPDAAKMPNDPAELRKWATKASQESAALREEMKGLKLSIEKLTKKPVDYKELAKNPELIQKQIEAERQEAIAEMQDKLAEATTKAVANETVVERIKREQDTVNYPEWKRVFPLIQNLASNTDGRINFNQAPADVLDSLYALAVQLAPVAPVAAAPVAPVTPAAPAKTQAEIDAEIAAAEKRGFEKAQEAIRAEQAGGGIGSRGNGGRRSSGTSKEALQTMPLKDLKALISKE